MDHALKREIVVMNHWNIQQPMSTYRLALFLSFRDTVLILCSSKLLDDDPPFRPPWYRDDDAHARDRSALGFFPLLMCCNQRPQLLTTHYLFYAALGRINTQRTFHKRYSTELSRFGNDHLRSD